MAYAKKLFLTAAIYDIVLGIAFMLLYQPIFTLFNIALPTYPMYLQMAAALILIIGIGFYFVYLNPKKNRDLVKVGILQKIAYIVIASYYFFIGVAHIVFMIFVILDFVFLLFFVKHIKEIS
ncbi:MAG TPA: hypothetical protein VJH97_02115 [Candidatus Nanoarchaeia archaeon]|nr:hypothetical protein [Candidatus Nanoarchaeia archaeon]